MPLKHIAELTPELPARATVQFRAAVTLIWPYSSSQREFALLLAEPEFRLRRKKGQVRARFHGSSARALATTGVGIGDEVVLGLQDAQFVQEDTISTPGKSIDWELQYTQTVVVQVFRDGSQIANLEVVDAAPTPAPRSPVRAQPMLSQSPAQRWSSPAFLKRVRLSDGPFFEAPYDPLADDIEDGHARKRRCKSYRDWKAWTYSARTPSPSKEDAGDDDDVYATEASPSRLTQLPDTPISPPKPDESHAPTGVIDLASDDGSPSTPTHDEEAELVSQSITQSKMSQSDLIREDPNYDLYAGPDEIPPSEAPYAFGGDTEVNTEEDDDLEDTDGVSMSSTEANTEVPDDEHSRTLLPVHSHATVHANVHDPHPIRDGSLTEEDSMIEIVEPRDVPESSYEKSYDGAGPDISIQPSDQSNPPVISMPPPTLSALNTSFGGQFTPGLLTPTGREPDSPTLQPLDSATLPLPSPFPGERDGAISSYLDHVPDNEQSVQADSKTREKLDLPSDADYIGETSFFSSIGSSRIPATHPDHETAFTPVRFTFGLDGSGYSRPLQTSSPAPDDRDERISDEAQPSHRSHVGAIPFQIAKGVALVAENGLETALPSGSSAQEAEGIPSWQPIADVDPAEARPTDEVKVSEHFDEDRSATSPQVIELSSESEAENSGSRDEIIQHQSPLIEEELKNDVVLAGDTETHQPNPSQPQPEQSNIPPLQEPPMLEQDCTTAMGEGSLESVPQHIKTNPADLPDIDPFAEFMELSSPPQSHGNIEPGHTAALAEDVEVDGTEPRKLNDAQHNDGAAVADKLLSIEELAEQSSVHAFVSSKTAEATAITHQHPSSDENASGITDEDTVMVDASGVMQPSTANTKPEDDLHPDIKVESVEEDIPSLSQIHPAGPHPDADNEAAPGSSDTMLIEVPNIEHEIGELHTVAVPATSPAMNTRARTKTPVSPMREHSELSKLTARSTKSRASEARTTISPPATPKRSTMSPIQEVKRSSPYSLRSQSKPQSPMESTFDASTISPRRTRGHASQKSVGSIIDMSDTRSTRRISSESLSLEDNEAKPSEYTTDNIELKLPPSVRRPRTRAGAKAQPVTKEKEKPHEQRISPGKSHRRLRSTGSIVSFEEPSSPSIRTTRRHVYNLASTSPQLGEGSEMQTTPRPQKAGEGQLKPDQDAESQEEPAQQRSLRNRNRPLTPDATQDTTSDSHDNVSASQQQQHTLPLTPNLTQRTSSLRSFHKTIETQAEHTEEASHTSPVTKFTPRQKATETDVASATTSREQSPIGTMEQVEIFKPTEAETTTETVEAPTIGLSTPLAYYTPLNSLSYFLNRSSQFHSNSNPDILALVTSATTLPVRAPKGPKHWYTTLHVTDASVWPAHTTTVNVFRAYQSALPHADVGDVILLRAFGVKSLNRQPSLISADESAWCVWRFGRPVTGRKRGAYGELKAREEVKGPEVERGEGEWAEVGKVRSWFEGVVKGELKEREETKVVTRSRDKGSTAGEEEGEEQVKNGGGQRRLRSREVADAQDGAEEVVETRRQTRSQDKKG